MNIKKIVDSQKFYIFLLLIINLALFFVFYGKFNFFFFDTSREVFIPQQMNNGFLLYKDIFNVYAPLGYQLNQLLFSIFGEKLEVLYFFGFFNATAILIGLFYITNLIIKDKLLSFGLTTLCVTACVYSISQANYIFPYSYSIVYALCAFVYSLLTLLKYTKTNKTKYLYLSFLLYGLSISFKYEYILFGFVLVTFLLIRKLNFQKLIVCFLLSAIFPIVSISLLISQGVSINDFINSTELIKELANAKSTILLYLNMGLIPTKISLVEVLKSTAISSVFLYFLYFIFSFILNRNLNDIFKYFFLIIISIFCINNLSFFLKEQNCFVDGIGFITLFLFILYLVKTKNNNDIKCDSAIVLITISSFLISLKTIFSVNLNYYGTYFFPILLISSTSLFLEIKKNKIERKIISLIIFVISSSFLFANIERANSIFSKEIKIEKGTIFVNDEKEKAIKDCIGFINNETTLENSILVLPEGAMINFLTDRKSHNKFFYLIPPNIEIFGNDYIITELKKDLPDYIILTSITYSNFGETSFCNSSGKEICKIIPQYYEKPKTFGSNFIIDIYKKKENLTCYNENK